MDENRLYPNLKRGTVVQALQEIDPYGADVSKGALGIVFEEADFHEEGTGPMVRWLIEERGQATQPGGACNIYEGDVRVY